MRADNIVDLIGEIEMADSEASGYLVLDDRGRQCVAEVDDHHHLIKFDIFDEEPVAEHLLKLNLMREKFK